MENIKIGLKNNNRGSAVIEISLLMPVVLSLVVSCIFLFIDSINDSVIRSDSYITLYTYSIEDAQEKEDECFVNINNHLVGAYSIEEGNISDDGEEVSIELNENDILGGKTHKYVFGAKSYRTEYDLCTKRLRRWQLHGDIVQQ